MARTGEKENKVANEQHTAEEQQSFATGQQAVHSFTAGENALERGGQVGANPYLNPQYLASVNRLQAGALDSQNNAAKAELEARNRRSGGLNSTATTGAIKDIALQKMRLGDQLSSERTAGDFNKNLGWQQQLLQNRLAPAGVESPYYGTATGGRSDALKNLTQFGLQSQGFWNNLAMMGIKAAAGAAGGAVGGAGAIGGAAAGATG